MRTNNIWSNNRNKNNKNNLLESFYLRWLHMCPVRYVAIVMFACHGSWHIQFGWASHTLSVICGWSIGWNGRLRHINTKWHDKKKIVCSGRVVTQINDNCMKQKNVNAIWTNIVFVPVHYVTGLAMCVLIRNIILMWPESWRIGYGNSAEQKAWVCNNSPRSAWVRFLLFICRICGMECVWKKKYRC